MDIGLTVVLVFKEREYRVSARIGTGGNKIPVFVFTHESHTERRKQQEAPAHFFKARRADGGVAREGLLPGAWGRHRSRRRNALPAAA